MFEMKYRILIKAAGYVLVNFFFEKFDSNNSKTHLSKILQHNLVYELLGQKFSFGPIEELMNVFSMVK